MVGLNRFEQILRSAVMKEEDSLPEAPQGRCAKLIATRIALADIISQSRTHIVQQQIGKQIDVLVL